ncbi:MAG: hypothetical protein ACJAR1_001308 [Rubritalea sp.]|jgi:hypothetical protein|tara:strand:- start:3251 stop:4006 length:756 start_codon:yes stop_codon:yes gene_type:complete
MKSSVKTIITLTTGASLLVASAAMVQAQQIPQHEVGADARNVQAKLEQTIQQLQNKNQNLSKALVDSKQQTIRAKGKLNKIRLELEALGTYPLGTDDERLIQAVANRKVLEDRLAKLETAAMNLTAQVREYLKHAFVADDQQRLIFENKIRGLDVLLGIIDKPRPQIDLGTLYEAKIIGIDGQSGTLILNAGEKQQVRIGMTFRILRGKSQIAEARIAEVRPEIAGALVIRLDDTNNAVRPGDIASIKTQN